MRQTSTVTLGWESLAFRLLDLVFGIVPAAFISLMTLSLSITDFLYGTSNAINANPSFQFFNAYIVLYSFSIIYISVTLSKAKFKSQFVYLFCFGITLSFLPFLFLYRFTFFPNTILFLLIAADFVALKHIFMLTRKEFRGISMEVPNHIASIEVGKTIDSFILQNRNQWNILQVIFGSLPAGFLIIETAKNIFDAALKVNKNTSFWEFAFFLANTFLIFILIVIFLTPLAPKVQKFSDYSKKIYKALYPLVFLSSIRYFTGISSNASPYSILFAFSYLSIGLIMLLSSRKPENVSNVEVHP